MDDATLDQLLSDLTSPDPAVRDERGFGSLVQAISDGDLTDDQRARTAETARKRLRHNDVQARTFAPLVLAALVGAGEWDDAWFAGVRDWYLTETDLRGYDETLGWLHAVAHGADFFGECAATGRASGVEVLDVLVTRCVTPTEHVWRDQEEVRVATAMAMALTDSRLDATAAAEWLAPVREALAALDSSEPPAPPVWSSNVLRTLHALYVGLDHQVLRDGEPATVRHAAVAKAAVAATIQPTQPWFWRV